MSKKILAGFLSITMILSQAQEIAPNTYAVDTVSTTNTSNKEFSKTTKVAFGVGSGLLAVIGGVSIIAWGAYKYSKNATERMMRWVIDGKNKNLKNGTEYLFDQCHEKSFYPESVFAHVTKNSSNIAACYFGEGAIQKCMADAQSGADPYKNSTHAIGFSNGKYIMSSDPQREGVFEGFVPLDSDWVERGREETCDINMSFGGGWGSYGDNASRDGKPGKTKRFVELCGRIYEAEYDFQTGQLSIIDLKRGEVGNVVGYFIMVETGALVFNTENYGRRVDYSYPSQISFINENLPSICQKSKQDYIGE